MSIGMRSAALDRSTLGDPRVSDEVQPGLAGLRIALIGPLAPPAGGMANQTRQLNELLGAAGAAVVLVQTNRPYVPARVARLPGVRALFRLVPYLAELWRAMGRADVAHLMSNSGWAWHLFSVPAVWIAWLRGVPVLVNYRGGEAADFLARSAASVRLTMGRAAVLAVPSGFLQQLFERYRMPAAVLPNIVDVQRFRTDASVQRVPGAHVVVTRNLEPLYDNATAIRAFARVAAARPTARMTIAGSGPQESELKRLAAELGMAERVRFAGRLDRDAVAALLHSADLSLNPSLADNMPNSVLEALAAGVPVVSTAVGGVPFVVEHERTALLVPPGDAEAMAAAMQRVLDDASLRARLCAAGLAEAERYTWAAVAPLLAGLYRRLLERA
jgi:glycosyltransferase involved in cell wall biosynthesis